MLHAQQFRRLIAYHYESRIIRDLRKLTERKIAGNDVRKPIVVSYPDPNVRNDDCTYNNGLRTFGSGYKTIAYAQCVRGFIKAVNFKHQCYHVKDFFQICAMSGKRRFFCYHCSEYVPV